MKSGKLHLQRRMVLRKSASIIHIFVGGCWGFISYVYMGPHVSLVQTEQEYIPAHESLVLASLQTGMRANINFKGFYTGLACLLACFEANLEKLGTPTC